MRPGDQVRLVALTPAAERRLEQIGAETWEVLAVGDGADPAVRFRAVTVTGEHVIVAAESDGLYEFRRQGM